MKIEVDVKRIDQSWSFDTGEHQNYLVFEFLGNEVRVPCTPEQVAEAIGAFKGGEFEHEEDEVFVDPQSVAEDRPVVAVPTFADQRAEVDPEELPPAKAAPAPKRERKLQALTREKGDDAGIAQG